MKKSLFLFFILSLMFTSTVFAAGSSLFSSDGCIACHTINGNGGTVGPSLSNIGSRRSLHWIKTQIINPSAHFAPGSNVTINGNSYMVIMPSHKNMSKSEVDSLADYLESLK